MFRGEKESDVQQPRHQLDSLLSNPLVSQPEDVVRAILNVVQHPQAGVLVGFGALQQLFIASPQI